MLTDFSAGAESAASYALNLAQKANANLLICNMFLVPYTEPMTMQMAWPEESVNTIEEDSTAELMDLVARLNNILDYHPEGVGFRPEITYACKAGDISSILKEISTEYDLLMGVIAQHNGGKSINFMFDDHARKIIEKANFPVLIAPEKLGFKGFNKIAFATDLSTSDLTVLQALSALSKSFDSEIVVTHINDEDALDDNEEKRVEHFFARVSAEINNPKISFRTTKSNSVTRGLDWLAVNTNIDLMVLVHRKRNFLYRLLEGSVTHRMSANIFKPLLIFQAQ